MIPAIFALVLVGALNAKPAPLYSLPTTADCSVYREIAYRQIGYSLEAQGRMIDIASEEHNHGFTEALNREFNSIDARANYHVEYTRRAIAALERCLLRHPVKGQ